MGQRLQRNLGARRDLVPGQFCVEGSGVTQICCPRCGGVDALAPHHVVDRGGKVVPAWKCSTVTCPFFEFIELESYGEAA